MPVTNNHEGVIRRYLLGQLSEDEQNRVEERLMTEDDFFEELEIGKDELVDEYVARQLSGSDKQWFETNFLASPEGRRRLGLSKALNDYVLKNQTSLPSRTKSNWFGGFWNGQPVLARAAAAIIVVMIVVGLFWSLRVTRSPTVASLTLLPAQSTRSGDNGSNRIRLEADVLQLILQLPSPAESGSRYRVQLLNSQGATKVFEASSNDGRSVSVDIPAAQLQPGIHAVTVTAILPDGSLNRIPVNYRFTVE